MLKKCDGKNVGLEETVNSLKQSMKKFKDYSEGNLKQLIEDSEAERVRLEGIIEELKSSFEEALTQKDLLDNDNKKLRTIIEKKDQQERQRKQMLIDEFREIDKLDRIVRRM